MNQNLINEFKDKSFEFENKRYSVIECYRKDCKNHIVTPKRHFVYDDEQLELFMSKIKWVEGIVSSTLSVMNKVVGDLPAFDGVANGLKNMFDQLSNDSEPSKELLAKAKAMSSLSGAMVNVVRLEIDVLRFKKTV